MDVGDFLAFLLTLLEKEVQFQREILRCAREKRQCLLKNRMNELGDLLEQEGELVFQAKEIEVKIKRIWREIAPQMGLDPENLNISCLSALAGGEQGKRFLAVQQELREIVTELQRVNQENAMIIRDTLNYIEVMFSIILREFDRKEQSYGRFGSGFENGPCGLIINGVV
ncbi:MAG: flagellar protein FlgN [Atribacterota bacterium]|nr:flagellar protein FlgN [Atribacterota bacterium]